MSKVDVSSGNKTLTSLDSRLNSVIDSDDITIRTEGYYNLVSQGKIPSHEHGSKIGANKNIGTGRFVILSNAAVVHPGGQRGTVVSTSVEDSSAGTGLRKLRLVYFDSNWNKRTEYITMNGTTQVFTSGCDINRVESLDAIENGTYGVSVGTIALKSTDGAQLFAQIDPNRNFFERCLHYVPPGSMGFITDILVSSTSKEGVIYRLFSDIDFTLVGGNKVTQGRLSAETVDTSLVLNLNLPIVVDARNSSDGLGVGLAVVGLAATQSAVASFRYYDEN